MLANVYDRSPIWMQNLMVSAKGLDLRVRRASDARIRRHLDLLRHSRRWDAAQMEAYRTAQFQALLRTAFRHVPYYRELSAGLGCEPEDFRSPDDIRLLPLLPKSRVRDREHEFLNETVDLRKCTRIFTSGTTGTPITNYETRESWSKRLAFVARLREDIGLADPLHPRRLQFTGRDIVPARQAAKRHVFWRVNRADNALLLSTVHIAPAHAPAYLAAMRAFGAELMDGYPSSMLTLARCAADSPRPIVPGLRAIITTCETLWPEDRRELEEAFGCPVFDQYAASEPSCFWCDCADGVMHVNPEYGLSEILDGVGAEVGPGEKGVVPHTSFLNHALILIRYVIGDEVRRGPDQPCRCGRLTPRIERIENRTEDMLYVPGRGLVYRLDPIFKGLHSIIEAQIVQDELDSLLILLVPADGYDARLEELLVSNLRAKIGDAIRIRVEKVDSIPRGANGKFKALVSRVRHLYPPGFDAADRTGHLAADPPSLSPAP
jgi:phenylacetate-CoA ligase